MIKNVVKTLLKNRLYSILFLFIAIIGVVTFELFPSIILKNIVDVYLGGGMQLDNSLKNAVMLSAFTYLFAIILMQCFEILKQFMLMSLGQDVSFKIKCQMIEKLSKIETKYFSNNDVGEILSRFTNDIEAANSLFTDGIISMGIDLLKIVAVVIAMFTFDFRLGVFTIIIIPIIFFVTNIIKNKSRKSQMSSRKQIGMVNNHILETVRNHKIISIYGKEEYEKERYSKHLKLNFDELEKVNFFDSFFPPIMQLLTATVVLCIIVFSSGSLGILNISTGAVAGATTLILSLFVPIEKLGMELQTIQKAIAGAKRAQEFIDEKNDIKCNSLSISDIVKSNNEIKFENVKFSYDGRKIILNDISFMVNEHDMVSIIGETGVGKSTLFKLLTGGISPDEGEITLNGISVDTIPNELKASIFGVVEQGFSEVKGSLRDNICIKVGAANEARIFECLDIIGLRSVIQNLENGLDSKFEKKNFSEGQLELLAIARAIVLDPPILLFDEMTANLDSFTENLVLEALKKINENHIVLSISHRMSSVMLSKKVISLKDGKIAAIGSPKVVLSQNEQLKEMYILEKSNWR